MKNFKVCIAVLFLIGAMSSFSNGQSVILDGATGGGSWLVVPKEAKPSHGNDGLGINSLTVPVVEPTTTACGDTQCWNVYGFVCLNDFDGTIDEAADDALFYKYLEIDWILSHYDFVCNWNTSPVTCRFEFDFDSLNVYLVKECKLTVVFQGEPLDPDDIENDPLAELLMELFG